MIKDQEFLSLLESINQEFSGWDFSYVTDTERIKSSLLSWSYGSLAMSLIKNAKSMLDMGTGGGEFLTRLQPFPELVCATEGYAPNVPIAKKQLEPLGVKVAAVENDENLPFEDGQFDLVLNKHESFSATEVRRIMTEQGIFLTQQVGGLSCKEINKRLGAELNEYQDWNMAKALEGIEKEKFTILLSKEEFPIKRYYDIGALVFYLKAIPWQIPDFSIDKYMDELYKIHLLIQEQGYLEVKEHRFVILAEAK